MLRNSFSLFFVLIMITSCDSNGVYDAYKSVSNSWHKDSIINFKFNTRDTVSTYNLYVNLRNTNTYKYSNLFLIVEMVYPHGKITKDTLEYRMAEPNGKLLGTGLTDVKENKLWYKGHDSKFIFKELGDYTFNIQHAMRENGKVNGVAELKGIIDVGFRIENSTEN